MAKSPRRNRHVGGEVRPKNEPAALADDRATKLLSVAQANVSERDIARRAYELYLARGREHGRDLDDWLAAERELHVDPQC